MEKLNKNFLIVVPAEDIKSAIEKGIKETAEIGSFSKEHSDEICSYIRQSFIVNQSLNVLGICIMFFSGVSEFKRLMELNSFYLNETMAFMYANAIKESLEQIHPIVHQCFEENIQK